MKYGLFILVLLMFFQSKAQLYQNKEKYHVGIKAGIGPTTLTGSELKNNRTKVGFQGGFFYRHTLGKNFHFQSELLASYKGARFDNGPGTYQRINLLYADAPQLLMVDVSKKQNKHLVILGPQLSVLLNSEMYVDGAFKAKQRDLGLTATDFFAVAGYQFNGYYNGIQVALRYGLRNINNNLYFKDVEPITGTGKSIKNFGVDISVLF